MAERIYEEWLAAVKKKGKTLHFVPEYLKTEELCLAAVKQNSMALEYVPEELKEQVRKAAWKRKGNRK